MKMHTFKLLIISSAFLLLVSGCGRKQKNFLTFKKDDSTKICKLDLPAVKGIVIQKIESGFYISWLPLFSSKTPQYLKKFESSLVGYNVFKLVNTKFIPKHPLNQAPITTTFFIDTKKTNVQDSYTIQPVFRFDNQTIAGPLSEIVKT